MGLIMLLTRRGNPGLHGRKSFQWARFMSRVVNSLDERIKLDLLSRDVHQVRAAELLDDVYLHLAGEKHLEKPSLYLYGGVGTGKSMLMDLLYDTCGSIPSQRVHFHEFMLDVHARIHKLQRDTRGTEGDVLPKLTQQIAQQTQLICFDEFQITDIA